MMTLSFNKLSTDILYFKPQDKPYPWGDRKLLAWPVFAYKVVAPEPKERQINILQKTVLGLSQIGWLDAKRISDFIGIHHDLIEKVFEELRDLNLVDEDRFITKQGKGLLQEEVDPYAEMISGYIFQDPFTGEFWNRFIKDISENLKEKVKPNNEFRIDLDNKNQLIHFIEPSQETTVNPPTIDDIRKITNTHKQLSYGANFNNKHEKMFNLYKNASLVNEHPTNLFWLATWIYFPQEISKGASWNVYDPFGLENDFNFRKRIVKIAEKNKQLAHTIFSFVGDVTLAATENLADILAAQNKDLTSQIKEQFGDAIQSHHPDLFKSLLKLRVDYNQMRNDTGGNKESLANNIHRVIESLFSEISTEFSPKESYKKIVLIKNDVYENRKNLKFFLKNKIGLKKKKVVEEYAKLPIGQIISACNYDSGRIKVRLLANLFVATNNYKHPLFDILEKVPDIFEQFQAIENLRNASAHGGKRNGIDKTNILREDYLKYVNFSSTLIAKLLPTIENNKIEVQTNTKLDAELKKAAALIESEANFKVKQQFGKDIVRYENLYVELANLFSAYSRYEKSHYSKYEVGKVANNFTKVLEVIFKIINSNFSLDNINVLSQNKSKNALLLNKVAVELQFNVEKGIDKSVTSVILYKIENQSTLNGKILYSLLATSDHQNHPFAHLSKDHADFFDYVAEVQQKIRQNVAHAGEGDSFSAEYVKKIYEKTILVVKCLFNYLNKGE